MAIERWTTTSVFLLISIFLADNEAATSQIIQRPISVRVFQGDSVILNCTFRLEGLGTYSWRRDNSVIDFESPKYKKRVIKADYNAFKLRRDASIQINNMTECDSGIYYCEIDIMGKQKLVGNGSSVIVQHSCDKPNRSSLQFEWLWIAVAGGVTLLVTLPLLVVIIVLAQRNKAYALLVRECSSFDSAKEPELSNRNKAQNHATHQHEDAYLHCHVNEPKAKKKRPLPARRNMQ
ncbi:natural cytotoxicity triggering receptor 3-like isoform X2 [Heterodontus francisci]